MSLPAGHDAHASVAWRAAHRTAAEGVESRRCSVGRGAPFGQPGDWRGLSGALCGRFQCRGLWHGMAIASRGFA